MKKILLLLVGMFVAIAANAELYLCGDWVAPSYQASLRQNWTPANAETVSQNSDGYYCFVTEGTNFKMSTVKADWNSGFNDNSRTVAGWTDKPGADGVKISTLNANRSAADNQGPFGTTKTYYRVSADLSTIEASKTTDFGDVEDPDSYTVYFYENPDNPTNGYIHAYMWGTDGSYSEYNSSPAVTKMVPAKYVKVGDNFYEVYSLTVSSTKKLENIIFHNGSQNSNLKYTPDAGLKLVKNGLYYRSGETSYTASTDFKLYDQPAEIKNYTYHLHNFTTLEGTRIQLNPTADENIFTGSIQYNAPLAEAQEYTVHRFDSDTQSFDAFGSTPDFEYNLQESSATLVSGAKGIVMPKGLKGKVSFTMEVEGQVPVRLTVSGGELAENAYTYYLEHSFKSPDGQQLTDKIEFRPHAYHFDADYVFSGEETGHLFKIERFLNGTSVTETRFGPVKTSGKYDPSRPSTTYSLTNNGSETDILSAGIHGKVRFTLHVNEDGAPATVTLRGGTSDKEYNSELYTVYFYAKESQISGNLYAVVYREEGDQVTAELTPEQAQMTPTGKYVLVDGEYCPVYRRSFTGDFDAVPHTVKIHTGDASAPLLTAEFLNYGFYTIGDTSPLLHLEQIYKPGTEPTTFYMHFKEDWLKNAKGDGNNPVVDPRFYIYSGTAPSGETAWTNGIAMEKINDLAPTGDMSVTEKYQLWKVTVPADRMKDADGMCFVYQTRWSDNPYHVYYSRSGVDDTYIYATADDANGRYAVQTYLSYQDFRDLDAEGRPAIYLVGADNGTIADISWDTWKALKQTSTDGYFFIPITVDASNQSPAKFKISWICVKDAMDKIGVSEENRNIDTQRAWSTFDLGIIGVDDIYDYGESGYTAPTFEDDEDGTSIKNAICKPYESIRYLNYNQYNFFISYEDIHVGKNCYIVVDPECRTVTVIPYDPNPKVSASFSEFGTEELTSWEDMQAFHSHYSHLSGAAGNGHIYMSKFNTCRGTVTIDRAQGADLERTGFSVVYTVSMNGQEIFRHKKPEILNFDRLPMGMEGSLKLQALYTNATTGESFHSRITTGTILHGDEEFPAPEGKIVSARPVVDTDLSVGLLIEVKYTKDVFGHNYYGDFSFGVKDKNGNYRKLRGELLHPAHRLVTFYGELASKVLDSWTYLTETADYDASRHDWSSKLFSETDGSSVSGHTFIFLHNAAPNLDGLSELETIEGTVSAVYPFLYNNNPTPMVASAEGESSGSARVSAAYEGCTISNMMTPSNLMTFAVPQDNILSGIENVISEKDDDIPAEFYTVSGIRVDGEPTPGIYLRRKGNIVEKVIIR